MSLLTLSIINIITFVYVYIVLYATALIILFLLLLPFFHNISTFYDLKTVYNISYKFLFLTVLLSMAGVPPLGGFFAKLALLSLIMNSYSIVFFVFFTSLLLFALYFYLKNVRFLILPYNTSSNGAFIYSLSSGISYINLILLFILLFNFFIFNDVLLTITWLFIF